VKRILFDFLLYFILLKYALPHLTFQGSLVLRSFECKLFNHALMICLIDQLNTTLSC